MDLTSCLAWKMFHHNLNSFLKTARDDNQSGKKHGYLSIATSTFWQAKYPLFFYLPSLLSVMES